MVGLAWFGFGLVDGCSYATELATSSAPNSRALASRRHHRLFPVSENMLFLKRVT